MVYVLNNKGVNFVTVWDDFWDSASRVQINEIELYGERWNLPLHVGLIVVY